MTRPLKIVKGLWRKLPAPARRTVAHFPPLNWMRNRMSKLALRGAEHQEIYDEAYYRNRSASKSAAIMARTMMNDFQPKAVIDVGCGTGDILQHLGSQGVRGKGLEYSDAALVICRERNLDVTKFDLESVQPLNHDRFDLAISTEVAEHLPESCADRYVDLLCALSDTVIFTAAVPGQGGKDHVNEQPHEYWLQKFASRGFGFDRARSERWRVEWADAGTESWYHENLMIVVRGTDNND